MIYLFVRVEGYLETTVPFSLHDNSPSLLMLANKFGGIDVRTKMENSQVYFLLNTQQMINLYLLFI